MELPVLFIGLLVAQFGIAALIVWALDRCSGPDDCGASGPFNPPIIPGI